MTQREGPQPSDSARTSRGPFGRLGVGPSIGTVLLLGAGLLAGLFGASERAIRRPYSIPPESLILSSDEDRTYGSEEAANDRGRHLVTVVSQCAYCHGPDLGGREMADDPWIGQLDASNLTSGAGGVGAAYSRADWVRAIRFGVDRAGRSLLLMPSAHLSEMSDSDLAAVIDYLEQIPAVDREPRPARIGWLTRLALATGQAEGLLSAEGIDPKDPPPREFRPSRSAAYGRYLVDLGSCRICHHADLRGGLHPLALPGEPPPSDLRPGGALDGWTLADFERAMQEGATPDGRVLDRSYMPWPAFAGLEAMEVEAIWLYLQSLSPEVARGDTDRLASAR